MMIPFLQVLILTFIHLKTADDRQESSYTVRVQPHKEKDEESSAPRTNQGMLKFAIILRDFVLPIFVLSFFIVYMTAGILEANK